MKAHRAAPLLRPALWLAAAVCLLAQSGTAQPRAVAAAPAGGPRYLAPPSPALDALVAQGRIEILERYGPAGRPPTLLLVRELESMMGAPASVAGTASALATAPGAAVVPETINLHRRTIDTSAGAALSAIPVRPGAAGGMEIVQFAGPLKPEWLAALRADGRIPISYIPHNSWLVWTPDTAPQLQSQLPLHWREPLQEMDRLSADLVADGSDQAVSLQIVRAGNHDAVLERARSVAASIIMDAQGTGPVTTLRAVLPADAVAQLAAEPEVVWIEPFTPPVLHDERSDLVVAGMTKGNRPQAPGYVGWLADQDLDDVGHVIVDVTDTGIDTGGTQVEHPGLRGRVAYARDFTGEGMLEDCVGHGTSMAGIIAGSATGGNNQTDADGYLIGLGVAPSVRVGSTRIFKCNGAFLPGPSFTALVAHAAASGARIGNNSWGGQGTAYNTIDQEYDMLVRDANRDPNDGEQPFLPIFSAGNLGPRRGSVGWPSTSKNVLSVGGSEGYRPNFSDGCGVGTILSDHVDHVLAMGGRGPTADGRYKPDVVAPGSHIQSLASRSQLYNGLGNCDPWYPPGQTLSALSSGTSQAAAHTTGAAALASELYRRFTGAWPSPAMLKAMLINQAHDLGTTPALPSNTTFRPNLEQGWGRVDLGSMVRNDARVLIDQSVIMTATGDEEHRGPMVADDPNRSVVLTLVWTDAPGAVLGWSFVNDLDLIVESEGVTYLGNVFKDGYSLPGGTADFRNNVEEVVLPARARSFTVTVRASNIAGDALPYRPGETDQDFALYVSNARLPEAEARLAFAAPGAVCGQPLRVKLSDSDLRGLARAVVNLTSSGDEESVLMDETPSESGLFTGLIDVRSGAPVPGNGVLETSHGTAVVASYDDLDPDSGQPAVRQAAGTIRCIPPVITSLRVAQVGDTAASIEWTTDRPANSQIRLTPPAGPVQLITDAKLVTRHTMRLSGLVACGVHKATALSTDDAGLTSQAPASPLVFSSGPGAGGRRVIFADDMEGLATRWRHEAVGGTGSIDDWELGHPALAPTRTGGGRAWGTNLDGLYSAGVDSALVTPPIDLRDAIGPTLTLQHFVDILGGRTPASLNDGAWVEISSDGGATWSVLEPQSGYPDTIDPTNPWLPASARVYAGTFPAWLPATFDLSSFSGSVVEIRFRLWQDAVHGGTRGAGWYLDDLEVTAQGTCHQGRLRLDADEYGCTGRVVVRLSDTDLDRSMGGDTTTVVAYAPSGTHAVTLSETPTHAGEFTGVLSLSKIPSGSALQVSPGDQILVRYDDVDDGSGRPAAISSAALVPECEPPPAPTAVKAYTTGAGRLQVTWDATAPTSVPDLQGFRVNYDTDGSGPTYSGSGAFQGASPVRSEASAATLALTAMGACAPTFVAVTSFDALGNESDYSQESYDMPAGTSACAAGRVTSAPPEVGCSQSLSLSLSDANADPDTLTPGTLLVEASSPTQPSPLSVALVETGPATGVFTGFLPLAPAPGAGALAVSEGDVVTIAYDDADDGRRLSRRVQATTSVEDCSPPLIGDIILKGRASDRATLTWTTSEPATSTVQYGFDPSLGLTASTPGLSTTHEVLLTGLTACGNVYYTITSTDALLNTAVAQDSGGPLHFGVFEDHLIFRDDFESGPGQWTHRGMPQPTLGYDEWEFGSPALGVPGAPPSAWSGSSVWGTDLDGAYEVGADMVLVSPLISLTSAEAATLTFMHWYDIFSFPGPPDGFDDGGFVEISDDNGATWTYLVPIGGYPDRMASNPYVQFGAGAYGGSSGGWRPASFKLDAWAGRTIRIRFHLVQDQADGTSTPRAGWYLDDVEVLLSRPCHDAFVRLDRSLYACSGSSVMVQVEDRDLNLDPFLEETASVRLTSEAEPGGETLLLHETGPGTATFEGALPLDRFDAPGTLMVEDDDLITAEYEDLDDGTGQPAPKRATAGVQDCTPPALGSAQVTRVFPDGFEVAWTSDAPSDSRVFYGTSPAMPLSVTIGALTTQHLVRITGLSACTHYWFTIGSADAAGNLAREDATTGPREIDSSRRVTVLNEAFSSGAPGWSHAGHGDSWSLSDASGSAVMSPSGSYTRPTGTVNHDFVLLSPPINLAGLQSPRLSFTHSFGFASSFAGGDGGWLEAWNGWSWIRLEPDGGYPGWLDPEAGGAGQRLRGYAGTTAGWVPAQFDLSAVAGGMTRLRFRVFIEAAPGAVGAGWKLDDVRVTGETACRAGRLALERDAVSCAATSLQVGVQDTDLNLNPLQPDTASVTAASSGGGTPLLVTLVETAAASGEFTGEIPLSQAGAPGTLPVAAGDEITARYADQDAGLGLPAEQVAAVQVRGCAAPDLSRVTFSTDGRGAVVARWKTDRPATSEAALTPLSGPAISGSGHALVEGHQVRLEGVQPCETYQATVASTDADGNHASTSAGIVVEPIDRTILFSDDMEGPNPGWIAAGFIVEWQRGVPSPTYLDGPATAVSGTKVYGTDLNGSYDGGTNSTLTSPRIDLTGVTQARLRFWHWYDIYADDPPNSFDDAGWVEIQVEGISAPIYIQPIGGYTDLTDSVNGEPLLEGTPVFGGQSVDWERVDYDLSQFAGKAIRIRFRIWNDVNELILNNITGAGWYLDDVEVSTPRYCHPAPSIAPAPSIDIAQGATILAQVDGSGFRDGAVLSAGPGIALTSITIEPPLRISFTATAEARTPLGPREIVVINPDGQTARLGAGLLVTFAPGRADLNGSGSVGAEDLDLFAPAFGTRDGDLGFNPAADLNGDGSVDGLDLALLAATFGLVI